MSEPATLTCLEMHTRSEPEESSSGTNGRCEQGYEREMRNFGKPECEEG
jgi:hypothetical protein